MPESAENAYTESNPYWRSAMAKCPPSPVWQGTYYGHPLQPATFWSDGDMVDGGQCKLCHRVFRDELDIEEFGQCDVISEGTHSDAASGSEDRLHIDRKPTDG